MNSFYVNKVFLMILLLLNSTVFAKEITTVKNFSKDARISLQQHKPIFLYVSSISCVYCKRLDKDVIGPMLKSGDYEKKIIMRKITLEDTDPIIDFNGKLVIPEDFLVDYKINATPTLLFLDHQGKQLTKPLEGYLSADLFWYYLDKAIDRSVAKLRAKSH